MKKVLSIILSIALVATLFVGTSAQFVSAEETVTTETSSVDYGYESVFDFSQGIPSFTKKGGQDASFEQVIDNGDYALKITQSKSTYDGDYSRYLAEAFTIPTNANLPGNKKIVGMRMVYRLGTPVGGNIGFVINGGWTFNFLDPNNWDGNNKVFFDAGTYDKTLLFADYSKVQPGSSYQMDFQLHAKAGQPCEIYIYDIQYVYEVSEAKNALDPDKNYRFESIYDFSQSIPETTKAGGGDYTSEQVQDGGKWAWKLKQTASDGTGSYSKFKISSQITMPTGEGLAFNEKLIGMRMVYRLATPTGGNIGIISGGGWTFRYSENDGEYREGIYDQTLLFTDYTAWPAVKPGESYEFYFEPRSSAAGVPFEIYVYDMQFVYEVDSAEYRFSTVYDFENMTDAQAQAIFVYDRDNHSNVTVVNDETRNDKAVQILAYENTAKYGYYYTDYKINDFAIPNNKHCIGIRMQYQGINLYDARIEFVQSDWTGANFGTVTNVNTYNDVVLLFDDYSNLTIGKNSTLRFQIRSLEKNGQLPGIKIYKIEFLYDDVFDGITETIRDYEDKTEGVTYTTNGETITDNDEDITVTTFGKVGTSSYEYKNGIGQNGSMGLKRTTTDVSWHNAEILKISKEVMGSPNVIGMRLWVSLKNQGYPRIQIKQNGKWTTLQFNSPSNTLSAGSHDIVVMFDNGLIEMGVDGTEYDFKETRDEYDSYLCVDYGINSEIVFDNIELIYGDANSNAYFVDTFAISGSTDILTDVGVKGDAINFPSKFLSSESGYYFRGWSLTEGGSTITSGTHTYDDVTYYATWTPNLVVMRKWLLNDMSSPESVVKDVSGDGVEDIRDLVRLKKLLVNCGMIGDRFTFNNTDYELTLFDDFTGSTLNTNNWSIIEGNRSDTNAWSGDMVEVSDGNLVLNCSKDENGIYKTGAIGSAGKFDQAGGYFEARCKLQSTDGLWSAFWLMPYQLGMEEEGGSDGSEIDIFESPYYSQSRISHAVHYDGYGEGSGTESKYVKINDIYNGYHVFALEWTEDYYRFYVDGVMTYEISSDKIDICTVPTSLRFSVEQGAWAGTVNDDILPNGMLVDYVRVYRKVAN